MNMRNLLNELSFAEKLAFAERAGTQYFYLFQIAGGQRSPSPKLCRRLVAADPRLTVGELRPDIWPADGA